MAKTIEDIEVVDVEKRRVPSKHYVYVIVVKWSDGSSMVVYRRYSRFFDLQTQLLDKFPIEAGTTNPSLRIVPFLPGKIFFGRSQIREVAMKRLGEIDTYCKNLLALPSHISQCDEVLEFFEVEPDDLDPPKEQPKQKAEKKVDKITGPKRLEQFVVLADYQAQEKGELDLQTGMVVEVTEKSESGWWFVNAEEHQGWVPSTYLQPVSGSGGGDGPAPCLEDGQEENYICIETFTAENPDEVSLEKGVVVEVKQKNMDGWWTVRYQGQEGFAPATYLKKSNDPYAKSLIEKSRQSGVQIISNLAAVSNLITSSSPRNSGVFTSNSSPGNSTTTPATAASSGQGEGEDDEDVVTSKPEPLAKMMMKQRSLERGGSLKPPPRQNSIKKMTVMPPPPPAKTKSSYYITLADFEDTVGDGISFTEGETVKVLEKASNGWWFVERAQDQGWVPESYLQQVGESEQASEQRDSDEQKTDSDYSEEEEEEPPRPAPTAVGSLASRLSNVNTHSQSSDAGPPKPPGPSGSKPPALPFKPKAQDSDPQPAGPASTEEKGPSGIASALRSKFESRSSAPLPNKPSEKPGLTSKPNEKPGVPSKPSERPGLPNKPGEKPGLPSKPSEKPGLPNKAGDKPGLPNKPGNKPGLPNKLSERLGVPSKPAEKPWLPNKPSDKPELPFKQFEKPKPPGKPAEKRWTVNVEKKPERPDSGVVGGNVAGLASSLKARFESQQQDKPNTPVRQPAHSSKPTLPSKPKGETGGVQNRFSLPQGSSAETKPPSMQKPSLPSSASSSSTVTGKAFSRGSAGPPSLPTKPQSAAKAGWDSNNNSARGSGTPALSVGSRVSELSAKLNFGPGPTKRTEEVEDSKPQKSTVSSKPAPAQSEGGGGLEYEVVADFEGQGEGELDVQCGQVVQVLDQQQEEWWLVTFEGQQGWVPSSYLHPASEWDD